MSLSARTPFFAALVLAAGCAHHPTPLELVRFSDGAVASGLVDVQGKQIEITLPDGERFSGALSTVAEGTGSYLGLSAVGAEPASGLLLPLERSLSCYAVLTGSRGTVLEVDFIHDGKSNGEGFGRARTNRGEEYRLRTITRPRRRLAPTKK